MPLILNWLLRLLPTNPICLRIIRNGSRRSRQLMIRGGFLGALILVSFLILIFNAAPSGDALSLRALASVGAMIFTGVSVLEILLVCLLTPVFMAGAISHESNPRTWDILLTTPLNSLQIVLGNLFGRWFFVLALLLSTLPLFLILRYFGGVPSTSIIGGFLIAAMTSLFVASVAITLSVTRLGGRKAVFSFYVAIVVLIFATWACDNQMRTPVPGTSGATWTTVFTPLNPFLALEVLLSSRTYMPHDGVESSWLTRLWLGSPVATFNWLCALSSFAMIVFSTICVRVLARNGGTETMLRRLVGLPPPEAIQRDPQPVGRNAVAWREARRGAGGLTERLARWSFAGFAIAATIVLLGMHQNGAMSLGGLRNSLGFLLLGEISLVTLVAVNLSATAVSREREDGSLDIILTTPIQPGPYLRGKHRGLIRYLLPMILVPIASLLLVLLYEAFGGFGTPTTTPEVMASGTNVEVPLFQWEAAVAFTLMFTPFIGCCVMIGLLWSIRSRGTIGSIVAAVLIIGSLMGLLSLCAVPIMQYQLGPMIAAISPVNLILAGLDPTGWMPGALGGGGTLGSMGLWILGSGVFACGAYTFLAVLLHRHMSRTFMMTVRQLAGTS